MAQRKQTRTLLYGMSGVGKTYFARGYPKPLLGLMFDPEDKATPYYELGNVVETVEPWFESQQIQVKSIFNEKNELLVRLEFYRDMNPEQPTAYQAFKTRVVELYKEAGNPWQTIVLDSVTSMQEAFIDYDKYVLNKKYSDPRQYRADLKNEMSSQGLRRFPSLPCNVVWVAHTSEKDHETGEGLRRGVEAVGTLKSLLPTQFGEIYFAYVQKEKGKEGVTRSRLLRTQTDGEFEAATQIKAPDPCPMEYEALWTNWDKLP